MKISLARRKRQPLVFRRIRRREWEAFTEDRTWSLDNVVQLG